MVNALAYLADALIRRATDDISSYRGTFDWCAGYFAGFRFCACDEALLKPIRVSYLYPKGRVRRDTEVDHFKAEMDPKLSPVDAGQEFYTTFNEVGVPRPYNPWVASTDVQGELKPNIVRFSNTQHVRGDNPWDMTSTFQLEVDRIQSPNVYLSWKIWTWSSYRRQSTQRVYQEGSFRLTFSLVGVDILGSPPPIDWIKSRIWANVDFTEVKIAEGAAWQETFEKLMLNSNNISNLYQLASTWSDLAKAGKQGSKLFKRMSSAGGAETARYYWYRMDYDVRDFSKVADGRVVYGVSFDDVAKQLEVDELGQTRATLSRLGKQTNKVLDKPSSVWLGWRFSYNTSKADFLEALDFLERTGMVSSLLEARNVQDVMKALFGENQAERSTQRGYAVSGNTEVRVTVRYKPHFSGEVYNTGTAISKLINQVQWNIKKWGFQPNPYNIWDMIPISFVADYVYDIGGCLEVLSRNDIGDYFMVERATVTRKTVLVDEWNGVPVQLTYFSRRCPLQIPQLEIPFSAKKLGSGDASTKTRVMRLIDGISMLGGN